MRASGQSSPAPFHLPTSSVQMVIIIAKGHRQSVTLEPNFCPGGNHCLSALQSCNPPTRVLKK